MKFLNIRDGNWGLKLLALILALVIYHTLKTETRNRQNQKENDRSVFQTR